MALRAFLLACVIILRAASMDDFTFFLDAGDKLCLFEYFSDSTLVVYDVTSSSPNANSIHIADSEGHYLVKKENQYNFKESLTTTVGGNYEICIHNTDKTEQGFTFKLKWGIAAKDYSVLPKVKDLKPIEQDLLKLNDLADQYWHTVNYANANDREYAALRNDVTSKISFFTAILLIVMMVIGSLEVVLARRIIITKKIK